MIGKKKHNGRASAILKLDCGIILIGQKIGTENKDQPQIEVDFTVSQSQAVPIIVIPSSITAQYLSLEGQDSCRKVNYWGENTLNDSQICPGSEFTPIQG